MKGRDASKPLAYVSNRDKATRVGDFSRCGTGLLSLWPAPLAIIATKTVAVPSYVTTLDALLLVCPDAASRQLVEIADFPIACTSANLSGKPSIVTIESAMETFGQQVDLIVDGGESLYGVNGTIIDCSSFPPTVIRAGALSLEELQEVEPTLMQG